MIIKSCEIRVISVPMKQSLLVSFGELKEIQTLIIELKDEDWNIWYGESILVPFLSSSFTSFDVWRIVAKKYLKPLVQWYEIDDYEDRKKTISKFSKHLDQIYWYEMVKAWFNNACIHLLAKRKWLSVFQLFDVNKSEFNAQESISIWDFDSISAELDILKKKWYTFVKIKIWDNSDLDLLSTLIKSNPSLKIWVDANAWFNRWDTDSLLLFAKNSWVAFIEQPFWKERLFDHAQLQLWLKCWVSLDESIITINDLSDAINLVSCRMINIKIWRVWWLMHWIKLYELAERNHIDVRVWWMLETWIWRIYSLCLWALIQNEVWHDISEVNTRYEQDIVKKSYKIEEGKLKILNLTKDIEIDFEVYEKYTIEIF